jgi:hypothetical protein
MALLSDYVYPSTLTPVRVVQNTNLAGVYFQPIQGNGAGATYTNNGSLVALVIDGVTLNLGDAVCLAGQTAAAQNGVYELTTVGSTTVAWVLTRRADMQSGQQLRGGMHFPIGAGTTYAGSIITLVEPLPFYFGIDSVNFRKSGTAATV